MYYITLVDMITIENDVHIAHQGFTQEKTGSENGPFRKIRDLKTDTSQKSETLKRILHKNQRP